MGTISHIFMFRYVYFSYFWYLQGLSNAELTHIVTSVRQLNQQDHTLLIRGQFKLDEVNSYCKMLQEACRGTAAPFVICTTQNEWQEGNNMQSTAKYHKFIVVMFSFRSFG